MKIKSLLIAALLLCGASAQAQQEPEYVFQPHAYFQGMVGGQYTLGEAKFKDLLSPSALLGVGYQISPVFGLRLSIQGWEAKGGWVNPSEVYKWNYTIPQLDATFNLSNLFCGYNPKRFFNLSAFIGAGANFSYNNDDAQTIPLIVSDATGNNLELEYLWDGTRVYPVGRAGIDIDLRLSDRVKLAIEGSANITSDKFNSKKADNADWYFNALIGLKVALGKTYTVKETPAPAPVVVPAPVVEKPAPKPVEKPAPAPKVTEITRNVFFAIREHYINPEEQKKIDEVVAFMKENPNSKVTVTSYADKGTGNAKLNIKYSQNRTAAVVKALVDAGIDASRISADAKGDTVQPFAENDKNRVSIVVAK